MSDETTVKECFRFNEDTRDLVDKLEKRHEKLEEKIFEKLDDIEKGLARRLPTWATLYISFLMLLVGGLLAKAVFH